MSGFQTETLSTILSTYRIIHHTGSHTESYWNQSVFAGSLGQEGLCKRGWDEEAKVAMGWRSKSYNGRLLACVALSRIGIRSVGWKIPSTYEPSTGRLPDDLPTWSGKWRNSEEGGEAGSRWWCLNIKQCFRQQGRLAGFSPESFMKFGLTRVKSDVVWPRGCGRVTVTMLG